MPISNKLAIRFALHGCTNRPFFHLVVMKSHKGRNKEPIEQLGTYEPMINLHNEKLVAFNFERIKFWIAKGAKPTVPVLKLMGLAGFYPLHPTTYMDSKKNTKILIRREERRLAKEAEENAEAAESTDS